jgi:hypothetical protein
MSKKTIKALSAADILAVSDLKTETVTVKEWGGDVILRELDVAGRQTFAAAAAAGKDGLGLASVALCLSLCSECGGLLFTTDDADALLTKNPQVVERLARRVLEISGLAEEKKP